MENKVYLHSLCLPNAAQDGLFISTHYYSKSYHSSPYPFAFFPNKGIEELDFAPITILCGDNGSGKSTLLNILANILNISHNSLYNNSVYMKDYVDMCSCKYDYASPAWITKIITSDDVFNQSFLRREMNQSTHDRQEQTLNEAIHLANDRDLSVDFENPESVARLNRKVTAIKGNSGPYKLVMKEVGRDIVLHSNGENALEYFEEQIRPHGLYLLDEPENSLSIQHQLVLKQFIEEMVQTECCQFVIATHSPFLLALEGAKVYNLDLCPVQEQKWTDIENVRAYFKFFQQYASLFAEQPIIEESDRRTSQSIEISFWQLLAGRGFSRKDIEKWLKELKSPLRIEEFIKWTKEYQKVNANLFPTSGEIDACVTHICYYDERPKIIFE